MKITRVEADIVELAMEEPYEIAYGSVSRVQNILVRVYTSQGEVGFGVASPERPVTGEAVVPAHGMVAEVAPLLVGLDPLCPARVMAKIKKPLAAWPSIRSAVDMAIYDILGKVAQLPVYKLLGGFRRHIMTSMTLGIMDEEKTVRAAVAHVAAGFRALKIKGGKDVDEDIAKTLRIRDAVGKQIALRFDANQGYTVEEAVKYVTSTRQAKVEILEQPTPKTEMDLLGDVTRRVPVPVMADESLLNMRDAFRLAKRGLADMVNIKLMKVGGLLEASAISAVARAARMEVMVGCMDEMALGIAAGLAFACASPDVVYADLDGHIGLKGDPTAGALRLKRGVLYPNPTPGLGLCRTL